ncbi:MAG: class I SAM-dependent methyltransferase [Gammaproteobacteria bacterium]|nr:class I SAM-dependent methyltransferase [Gammaproteobacteria bacterium]MBU1623899.1 class I SAM-dependent methyltransferase [Gammaproteobacteria bacterium]MBU1982116.1 class I SAM-dependent methyltransferase [Gammaproteobacteria bacterium]
MRKIPPVMLALLLQLLAFVLVTFGTRLLALSLSPFGFAIACGLLAAAFSHLARQARWWLPIQLLFVPALAITLDTDIPPIAFLLAFLVMLLFYWSTFRTQVPLYLSSNKVWQALETQLPVDQPFEFVDLGSGIGGVLTHLSRTHPQGIFHGVETAPLPFAWSWLRIKFGGYRNCHVYWRSLWDCDLAKFDVAFAYLSPVPMAALWRKVQNEMQPGSLFISNTFAVDDHPPQKILETDDLHHSELYVWRK